MQGPQCVQGGTIGPGRPTFYSLFIVFFSSSILSLIMLFCLKLLYVSFSTILSLQRPSGRWEFEGNFQTLKLRQIGQLLKTLYNQRINVKTNTHKIYPSIFTIRYHTLTREEVYTTSSLMANLDKKEVNFSSYIILYTSSYLM